VNAGVSIDEAGRAVSSIKKFARQNIYARSAYRYRNLRAAYQLPDCASRSWSAQADGVGTKLKIAFLTGRHGTVGEELVNHCVNDIAVKERSLSFFLDYFAAGNAGCFGRGDCMYCARV